MNSVYDLYVWFIVFTKSYHSLRTAPAFQQLQDLATNPIVGDKRRNDPLSYTVGCLNALLWTAFVILAFVQVKIIIIIIYLICMMHIILSNCDWGGGRERLCVDGQKGE